MGTFSGTDWNMRWRSRSIFCDAPNCKTSHMLRLLIVAVCGSTHRQVSAWPSAKVKEQPLLCRVAGKLIQVHFGVPKSHHRSGALIPKALCWMLFSCSSIKTMALLGEGLRISADLCQHLR